MPHAVRQSTADLPNVASELIGSARHFVQHTGGLHEKYLHEEDAEMDEKHKDE